MSEQQPTTPAQPGWTRAFPWLIAFYLLGHFLWRTLTPAHEYPPRSIQIFEMVLDGMMLIAIFGTRKQIPAWLFGLAALAGVGLFAIRFNSDASWWTGHLMYSLR